MKKVSTFLFVLILVFTSSVFSQVPTNGLLAYYPFTGNANDASGNGNNGTVHGATLTADRFGNPNAAYNFGGAAYISYPELFPATQAAFTFSVWVNLSTFANAQQSILYKGAVQGEALLALTSAKKIQFSVKLSDGNWYSANALDTMKINTVYHIAGRYIKGSKIDLWINGVKQDTLVVPNLNLNVLVNFASTIGAYDGNGTYSQYWNGVIDDICFYNRALTDAEIVSLYQQPTNGLLAYYPFTGNANDASGNGNNGTVHGATLTADRFGNPNSAYNFGGAAYISYPELFHATQAAFTFSVWVNLNTFSNAAQSILYKGAEQGEAQVVLNAAKKIAFLVKLSDGNWYSANALDTMKNNTVYHIAGRYIKGSKIDLWINGVKQDTVVVPNLNLSVLANFYSTIGAYDGNGTYSQYWNGVIDDICFYNRALTDAEIVTLSLFKPTGIINSDDNYSMPKGFSLSQNYPNPFNPTTVINYQLPSSGKVVLKVYDVLGKEVATLVNGEQKAGSYNINFNASHLSSGIYFYKLSAGNYIQTKKMVLLK